MWMCVSDTKAVESVLFGEGGAEAGADSGHDYCRFEHDISVSNIALCRAREGAGSRLCGCSDDGIENCGRKRAA